jgi:methionyl-tRNA formyltransferase
MKIVFMGTPEFAVPSLQILVKNGYQVVAVITSPDKPSGRGQKLQFSAVKEAALALQIPVLQPEKLKNPDFLSDLKALNADLQIVVAFRMLPEAVWNMPTMGTFNLHASLLPQYRGAAPINWAIINGEQVTGATTFFLQHEIDTGDIIMQRQEPVYPTDTAGTLYERLKFLGADLVLQTVKAIENGKIKTIPQVLMGEPKPAPKIFKETCEVNFNLPAGKVVNFIRGLSPYPGAWATINGKVFKIIQASAVQGLPETENSSMIGEISSDGKTYLHVQCQDNTAIALEFIVPEGKKAMSIAEWLRGNRI